MNYVHDKQHDIPYTFISFRTLLARLPRNGRHLNNKSSLDTYNSFFLVFDKYFILFPFDL
jgi:hypothetical protein